MAPKKTRIYLYSVDTSESGDVIVKLRDIQSQGCEVRVQDIHDKYGWSRQV